MPAKTKSRKKPEHGSPVAAGLIAGMQSLIDDLKQGKLNARAVVITVPIPVMTPEEVKGVRETLGLSQPLFADFLGASAAAIRAWERGAKTPTPMARRFLDAIRNDPEYWRGKLACAASPAA